MKASVIIPVFNFPAIIDGLESFKHQTEKDFEILVCDDGSKDSTVQMVQEFSKQNPDLKISIFANKHLGPAKQRNFGAGQAKGDILLFTDADCYPLHNWIEEMLRPFEKEEIVGVVGTYQTWNMHKFMARFTGYEIALRHERMAKRKYTDFIGTYSAGYRKKLFLEEHGFDENFPIASGEDPELSFRLASKGHKMVLARNAKVKHKHPGSLKDYLKQKYNRGYWRIKLYENHPKKIKGESYTPFYVLAQIPLFFLLIASIPFAFFSLIPFFSILALEFILAFYESIGLFKFERKMFLAGPFIFFLRTASSSWGIINAIIGKVLK